MSRWKRETERERERKRKDSWLFRSCLLSECLSIQCDRRTSKRGNKTHPDSHRIIRIIHRLATVTIPSGPARHHNLRKAHAPSPNSGRDKLPIKLHFEKMTTTKTVPACYYIPINTILLFFVCLFVCLFGFSFRSGPSVTIFCWFQFEAPKAFLFETNVTFRSLISLAVSLTTCL